MAWHRISYVVSAGVTAGFVLAAADSVAQDGACGPLQIDVSRIEKRPSQYARFCANEPSACKLADASVIDWKETRSLLERINRAVNTEVTFVPDEPGEIGEECWQFPAAGAGDCEDFALEKRRRLVAEGIPSAALTMAIVHHKVQFFPHAVLLAETTQGTRVLDNLFDSVVCWDRVPYRYERRERTDGMWERYVVQ